MTKAQKIIVLAGAGLMIFVILFPPYSELQVNDKNELTGRWHIKWAFNKNLRDVIIDFKGVFSGEFKLTSVEYPLMRRLLFLEIFGSLVLAGAGALITKKRS